MKWNWGTGIVIAISSFMGFILFLVITMSTSQRYDHDMVTEHYYAKEMVYQQEINAQQNTHDLVDKVTSNRSTNGWELTFPASMDPTKIKGNVYLYRPSNARLDFALPITEATLIIPKDKLIEGRWDVNVEWTYENKNYQFKESINY